MNSDTGDSSRAHTRGEEIGEPILVLLQQEQSTSFDFVVKVRNRIGRRTTAAQIVSFSWHLPKTVLLEMLGLCKYLLTSVDGKKDSQP
jgi:hypothetical protein